MSLHPASVAELQALLSANYPLAGERGGLLGAVARRENGGRAVINAGGQDARLVSISAGSDPNPYVVTVCLYRKNLAPIPFFSSEPVPLVVPRCTALPRARISWGAGKTSQVVLVDFLHGARLTLDCASVTIDAIYDNITRSLSTVQDPFGPPMEFSASVVYGSLGSRLTTFTTELIPVPGSGRIALSQPIPDFAREVKINSSVAGATYDVFFGTSAQNPAIPFGAGASRLSYGSIVSTAPNNWLQIPNGTEFIDIEQTAGVLIGGQISLQYQLNL